MSVSVCSGAELIGFGKTRLWMIRHQRKTDQSEDPASRLKWLRVLQRGCSVARFLLVAFVHKKGAQDSNIEAFIIRIGCGG